MDTNIAAWMIGGGPRLEGLHAERDREQLRAFRESQHSARPSLLERLRRITRQRRDEVDLVCCGA